MKKLLIAEGLPRANRDRAKSRGLKLGSELYRQAVHALAPDLECDITYPADTDSALPTAYALSAYAGVALGGSSLHAYDEAPEVTRQVQLLHAAAEAGVPVFGSCWGLQIAVRAAGGMVRTNTLGREIGIARKITVSDAGHSHPLLSGKGPTYDALCIHYDEVTALPPESIVLARNARSSIQAAIVPLGNTEVWGVQYHPEFNPQQISLLLRLYANDMISQGFFSNQTELDAHTAKWAALAADPTRADIAWQLGMDRDTLDDGYRRLEIRNWLTNRVL
jgi:GMP synthase (glutamine-hydrolysing)